MPGSANFVGLFPLHYTIGTSASGAQTLDLHLLVSAPGETVTGTAAVTQAINPPLDLHSDVWGQFTYLTVQSPGISKILITAQGNTGGRGSNSIINFKLHLVVGTDWKEGVASYQYFDGSRWIDVSNVPARLTDSITSTVYPKSFEPGEEIRPFPPLTPLYAAPIHSALGSGNLAQLKSLAVQAQQQLDQQPELQKAIDAAKAEISRLQSL
ncbi:DUF1842 domain-containing protein [Pseudomonas cichorii]|uniref:DUF1842 domain-containing protein n=1 Tax=Pseudomonas cichorii TaxID=36746 RepID=UPI0018E5DDB0|nr:DUF1842 domain-containing protein [Pseudomonas cichorii]MBI6853767.1 DUF1842 domain-containing protein [Pseudomonas cichorii]